MRIIDADALKRHEQKIATEAWKMKIKASVETILNQFIDDINHAPTINAVPVVHSEWIPKEKADTPYGLEMECAKCGFSVIVNDALYFKFCPNCGAKMDGKDDDNEKAD